MNGARSVSVSRVKAVRQCSWPVGICRISGSSAVETPGTKPTGNLLAPEHTR